MCAVEISEAVSVGREVCRNPVEDHADAVLVQVVDQIHEILRRAITRCWREVARGLISPGAEKWVFHHGEKFNVGESQLADILGETRRGFAVSQRTVVLLWNTHP